MRILRVVLYCLLGGLSLTPVALGNGGFGDRIRRPALLNLNGGATYFGDSDCYLPVPVRL